ncbi:hypothetical protein ACFX2I_007331 [Malus domestica]
MAFLAPPPSLQSLLRAPLSFHKPKAQRTSSLNPSDQFSFQSKAGAACRRPSLATPLSAESKRNKYLQVGSNIVRKDYKKLAKELEAASPLQIMEKALDKFGNDIAIAFSGAEDVALVEYAKLTGRPFMVFSLDTGRLNPEAYHFFDTVEKHYGIHIEYMFPNAVEVQALCCRVRKVRPLRRALKGLHAWITGKRKDQSPGTRAEILVQVDPSLEGIDGGIGSLLKWNPVANAEGHDIWNFLQVMDVPVNPLHSQGYISIGCEPCTRPVLPGQHEREGRWWWEDAKAKECGLHNGHIEQKAALHLNGNGNGMSTTNGSANVPDIFNSKNLVSLSRTGIENLARLENRSEPWLVVLYAPWCHFSRAMEGSYVELAENLAGTWVKVGKFRSDGEHKEYAQRELKLGSFPTILFFPKHSSKPFKYPSEKRDVASLLAFGNALRLELNAPDRS